MLEFDAIHICKTCKTNPLDIFNETIHNHICWDCLDAQWELAMDEQMDSRSNLSGFIEIDDDDIPECEHCGMIQLGMECKYCSDNS